MLIYKLKIEVFSVERNVEVLIDLSLFGYNRVIIHDRILLCPRHRDRKFYIKLTMPECYLE